jgi:hypothetical protein
MRQQQAEALAGDWVQAWHRHDLDGIMAHYAEDVVFTSPFVATLANEPTVELRSAIAVRANFLKGLAAYPHLRFGRLDVLTGMSSMTVYYRSVKDKVAAEVMSLNVNGLIARVEGHYRAGDRQTTDSRGAG